MDNFNLFYENLLKSIINPKQEIGIPACVHAQQPIVPVDVFSKTANDIITAIPQDDSIENNSCNQCDTNNTETPQVDNSQILIQRNEDGIKMTIGDMDINISKNALDKIKEFLKQEENSISDIQGE